MLEHDVELPIRPLNIAMLELPIEGRVNALVLRTTNNSTYAIYPYAVRRGECLYAAVRKIADTVQREPRQFINGWLDDCNHAHILTSLGKWITPSVVESKTVWVDARR